MTNFPAANDPLVAELAIEISGAISHLSSKHNYRSPDRCDVAPRALVAVLATAIALNFRPSGYDALLKTVMEDLATVIKEARAAADKMTPAQRDAINPMHPCKCGQAAEAGLSENDLDVDAIGRAIAEALGIDPAKVKAIRMDAEGGDTTARGAARRKRFSPRA